MLVISILIAYNWLTHEECVGSQRCADCIGLETEKQERLIGTVEILPNGKIVFTDRLMNIKYNLKPCDEHCGIKEVSQFDKIKLTDPATKTSLYFDIEGEYISEKDEFVYSAVITLDTRKFINSAAIQDWSFDEIRKQYTPLEEETFLLNESHYAGLRTFLPHYYSKEQLQQAIPVKEVTWETSDSTLITIWFEQKPTKQNKWISVEQYDWAKGTEF